MQHFMCAFALLISAAKTFANLLPLDRFCNNENAVHGGDPIMRYGFPFLIDVLTSFCVSRSARSHASPVRGFRIVKSKLHPGTNFLSPNVRVVDSAAIRGLEYISEISAFLTLYAAMAPFIVSSTLMLSATCRFRNRTSSPI